LTPITQKPNDAIPSAEMLETLDRLCQDVRNEVWVVSGRDAEFLQNHLGSMARLGLSAEHGCSVKYPGQYNWVDLTEGVDMSWQDEVVQIFDYYTERTVGSFVERKKIAVSWHYRLADPDYGIFQANECKNHLEESLLSKRPIEIITGKKILEVRPIGFHKGAIVKRLLKNGADFMLCCGDDNTDEDMFRAARGVTDIQVFTIKVGTEFTMAKWRVKGVHELHDALTLLNGMESIDSLKNRKSNGLSEVKTENEVILPNSGKSKWWRKWL